MAFIRNQVRKARIVITRLVRICVYWSGKIRSPSKEAVEQDEGRVLLLSISLSRDIRRAGLSKTAQATKPLVML